MKAQLQELVNRHMKTQGTTVQGAIRDAVTDLFHIATENKIEVDDIIDGAKSVYNVENH